MQYSIRQQQRRATKHRWRIYVISAIFTGVIILGIIFWSSSSNQGTITQSDHGNQVPITSYATLNGKYISFRYKSSYAVQSLKASDGDLELYMLTADTNYPKHLSVSVSQLPGGSLDNNSAYNYRKTSPNLYISSDVNVDGSHASEWVKNDGSEITIFIPKGDTVAMLSFSTDNSTDNLQLEANTLLPTFRWK